MHRPLFRCLLLLVVAPTLGAQPSDTTRIATTPLFTGRDALVAAGLAATTIAIMQFDRELLEGLRDSVLQANRLYTRTANQLRHVHEKSLLALNVAVYAVGRLGRVERAADLGLHGAEALVVASFVSTLIKGSTGRARPFVDDTDPFLFRPGRGFVDGRYRSFPSLHEAGSFAAGTVLVAELNRWWPGSAWYLAPVVYGAAGLVGVARIYTNKHWTSDVVLGATIGSFAGLKVVRYHHSHPDNRIDRWLLFDPVGGTRIVLLSRRF